jgi:hypothetical protein
LTKVELLAAMQPVPFLRPRRREDRRGRDRPHQRTVLILKRDYSEARPMKNSRKAQAFLLFFAFGIYAYFMPFS